MSLLILAVAALTTVHAECLKTDPSYYFDLPAGDPAIALVVAHQQGHVDIGYESAETLQGVRLRSVSGWLTLCDALTRMFTGTGLTYELTGPHSIRILSAVSKPHFPRGADKIESTDATIQSVTRRGIDITQPPHIEEVVVTGSLIRGVQDMTSPLIFIRDEQLQHAPYATVEDAVRTLPLASRAGPNEQYDPTSSSGNFNRGESINLRGLGAGATLVLVDGQRQPASGYLADFVDVSNIPWAFVERIDILPDGASALYGSDAVAGVVNVILRQSLDGAETKARIGTAPDGAHESLAAQLVGKHWDTGKVLVGYQFLKRSPLDASVRGFAANDDKRPLGGTDLRSPFSNPGNLLDPATEIPIAGIPLGQSGAPLYASQLLSGEVNLQNRMKDVQLLPNRLTHAFYVSASQAVSDRTQLTFEARLAQRDVSQVFPASDGVLFVPTSNPFLVGGSNSLGYHLVGYSFLNDLGPITGSGRTRSTSGSLGINTDLTGSWRVSFHSTFGREAMSWRDEGEVNYAALAPALADSDPATAFDPFGDGSHTNQHTLDEVGTDQRVAARSYVWDSSVVADGSLFTLAAGDARLAMGAGYRQEGLTHELPSSARFKRTISSVFTELAVPLIGPYDAPKAPPRLKLSVSGRSEYYSDFGATTNPRIGLQWVPSQQVKVRASWGTSFRAPTLVDLYDSTDNAAGILSISDPKAASGRAIVLLEQGNNPNLRDESASTVTAGIDLIPRDLPGFSTSLTYYYINYKNRVFHPGPSVSLETILSDPKYSPLVTHNPPLAEVEALCSSPMFLGPSSQCQVTVPTVIVDGRLLNLSRTTMSGVDLQIGQLLDTAVGKFSLRVDGAYRFSYKQAVSDAVPATNLLNTVGNPLSLRIRGTTEWNQRGSTQPGFGIGIAVDYSDAYRDTTVVPNVSVRSSTLTDTDIHYRTGKGTGWLDNSEITLNVSNVFNRAPPFVNLEIGYDDANASPLGRVVSLYVSKDW